MTWLAIKLFMGKALGAVLNALRWLMAHPWQAACIGLVCVSVWQWRGKQAALSDLAACETKSAQLSAAIDAANKLAEQARAKSVSVAKKADQDHEQRSKAGAIATDRFIANRRIVQPESGVSSSEAGEGAGNDQNAPAVPFVAVSEQDVRTASALQDYANTCHAWGQELIAAGLAD